MPTSRRTTSSPRRPERRRASLLLALAALGALPVPSLASDDDATLARCARIDGAAARLACYDALAGRDAGGSAAVAPEPPAAASPEQTFGARDLPRPPPAATEPEEIRTRLLGRLDGWKRGQLFRLENGQVWKSIDYDESWLAAEQPEVVIKKNLLGNYFMHFEGRNAAVRVRRVQ